MATLDAGTNSTDLNMFFGNDVNHASQGVGPTSSQYSWNTTSGIVITAHSFADDITFSATAPTGGSVHALQASGVYSVGGMFGNLVAITKAPNLETYWETILAGETDIFASPNASFNGSGDFRTVDKAQAGAADVFEGIAQPGVETQTFLGDADFVDDTGNLTGGKDIINMRAEGTIAGDVFSVQGKMTGGADVITVDNSKIVGGATQISGDAIAITDLENQTVTPVIVGGADKIFIKSYGSSENIAGDLINTFADKGTTTGGNDLIDATGDLGFLRASGDVLNLSNGLVRGGNDTMIASKTGNAEFAGDAFDVNGGQLLAGADNLTGSENGDVLMGEFINLSAGTVAVNASFTGNDVMYGAGGGDVMRGQVGNDIVDGGFGGDILDGGTHTGGVGDTVSFATLNVGVSADLVLGFAIGQGDDTLENFESMRGSNKQDSLGGDTGANRIEGLNGDDQIQGRGGADTLIGLTGNDAIAGASGNDTISGGAGVDKLNGGNGNDIFDYNAVTESGITAATRDVIGGFIQGGVNGDKFDLNTIDAKDGTAGNQDFIFKGAGAFNGEGQIRATTAGGITTIEINTLGVSVAEMTIQVNGTFTLLGTDFIV